MAETPRVAPRSTTREQGWTRCCVASETVCLRLAMAVVVMLSYDYAVIVITRSFSFGTSDEVSANASRSGASPNPICFLPPASTPFVSALLQCVGAFIQGEHSAKQFLYSLVVSVVRAQDMAPMHRTVVILTCKKRWVYRCCSSILPTGGTSPGSRCTERPSSV